MTDTNSNDANTNDQDEVSADTSIVAATGGASNLFYFVIPAPDLERSKAFYGALFGWVIDGGSLGGHISNITPSGGLMPGGAPDERSVFITVDDVEVSAAKVVELGGRVDGEVQTAEPGTWVSCRDNQGTQFHLQDPKGGAHVDYARNPQPGSSHGDLFYFSLPVADGEIGRRFYSEVFGWDLGEPGSEGGMNARNVTIEGGIGAGREGDHVELWFRVDDINAAVNTVTELGGEASEVFDTPEGLIAQCADDQGVEFGLAQPAAGF
jgi:predicted enzyme related to lactoylglutathione lyase